MMRAHQHQRELAGEELVIGKPRPGRRAGEHIVRRGRTVNSLQRIAERGKAGTREESCVLPFRQRRKLAQRRLDRTADLARRQSFRQRVDRLDQWQRRKLRLGDHAVGMRHLQHAVIERDGAGHVAPRSDRKKLLQILSPRVEVDEDEIAGPIARIDEIGRARATRRRRAVALHGHGDGDDSSRHDVAQLGTRSAID